MCKIGISIPHTVQQVLRNRQGIRELAGRLLVSSKKIGKEHQFRGNPVYSSSAVNGAEKNSVTAWIKQPLNLRWIVEILEVGFVAAPTGFSSLQFIRIACFISSLTPMQLSILHHSIINHKRWQWRRIATWGLPTQCRR